MFPDRSLIPAEAVRLAALGVLAEGPRRYGDLAMAIRHFIALAVGPSLDLMGTSLEMLRFEGLVAASDGTGMSDNALLSLTPAGEATLRDLLKARLRVPSTDEGRLGLFLKLRFLHHLPAADQAAQRSRIADTLEADLARLNELRERYGAAAPLFADWLNRDISRLQAQLDELRRVG